MASLLPSVVRNASKAHTATVIFLHGLGDTGRGWSPVGDQISRKLPHVKFIFPHAPKQPVSLNGGMIMSSWYDIESLESIDQRPDEKGLLESVQRVNQLIQAEIDAGIPANRIVVGGFSQVLKSERTFAGAIGLSGYVPLPNKISSMASEASKKTPIFWGHGDSDEIIASRFANLANDYFTKEGYQINFNIYPGMAHSACNEEIADMAEFLTAVLPQAEA